MSGSITVPTTTVASSEAMSSIVAPTSENSPRERSRPAVMFTRMPRAPLRSMSSSSGLLIARSAASLARLSPLALPVPIIADPISDITVRTSAKSTFTRPGRMIRSAIPCTAPNRTSLASLKASSSVVLEPSTSNSLSFGIVIRESQCCAISVSPSSAVLSRFLPSKLNGRVTTATVRIPSSLATSATIGAAPVPVPPPMPAVTNTMSAPCKASAMRSRSSRAAARPTSGLAPAPRPFVIPAPNCSTVFELISERACASVLAQIKSTPSTW